jgi:hypothetical protein
VDHFVTRDAARERIRELLDQVDAAHDEMRALSSDGVGNAFRVELAERLEAQERTNRGLMYRVFGEIADPPDEVGLVPAVLDRLWARLRVPPRENKRRMRLAARIRPRRQLSGPSTPPELPLVAQAVENGTIGEDHLRTICRAMDTLPSCVSDTDRADVEARLVREASKNDAEIVRAVGRRIDEIFNPDGTLTEVADERSGAQRCHDGVKLGLKAGIASGEMGQHRGPTTTWSPRAIGTPWSPTPADWRGPTAPNHSKSTTPTIPKNSSAAMPTRQMMTRGERAQLLN